MIVTMSVYETYEITERERGREGGYMESTTSRTAEKTVDLFSMNRNSINHEKFSFKLVAK